MRATTCVNSGTADLSCAAKKSASDACPLRAPREPHLAPDVGQTIFLVRRIFETILLPHLADSDPHKWSAGGVQGRDRPVWSDCPRYGNEHTYEHYCCHDPNNLSPICLFHVPNSNPELSRLTKDRHFTHRPVVGEIACLQQLAGYSIYFG